MEILKRPLARGAIVAGLGLLSLEACSSDDRNLTNPTEVSCDDQLTKSDVASGVAYFVVRGKDGTAPTAVLVERSKTESSLGTQELGQDVLTSNDVDMVAEMPVQEGPEFIFRAAGADWVVDVQDTSVVISGNCE